MVIYVRICFLDYQKVSELEMPCLLRCRCSVFLRCSPLPLGRDLSLLVTRSATLPADYVLRPFSFSCAAEDSIQWCLTSFNFGKYLSEFIKFYQSFIPLHNIEFVIMICPISHHFTDLPVAIYGCHGEAGRIGPSSFSALNSKLLVLGREWCGLKPWEKAIVKWWMAIKPWTVTHIKGFPWFSHAKWLMCFLCFFF